MDGGGFEQSPGRVWQNRGTSKAGLLCEATPKGGKKSGPSNCAATGGAGRCALTDEAMTKRSARPEPSRSLNTTRLNRPGLPMGAPGEDGGRQGTSFSMHPPSTKIPKSIPIPCAIYPAFSRARRNALSSKRVSPLHFLSSFLCLTRQVRA